MDKKFSINNEELMNNLLALAMMCLNNDTDNCDLTISTDKGKIICHVQFEEALESEGE